jgi:type I restriction enzyme S subunit
MECSEQVRASLSGLSAGGGDRRAVPGVNPDWSKLQLFRKKGWIHVRFSDVVENLNETESNPAEVGLERFIGLEHVQPGSLHIETWGNVADGTTFTRRCRPGQVLFGKRRAYQRKVAAAEFEAVVSGDIYVLAPKNGGLLAELLPFICLTERFFQHAVGTSAGSLSPRTNWTSLASFEFDLPPLDQQRRIAEILWTVDKDEQEKSNLAKNVHLLAVAELEEELKGLFKGPCERLDAVLTGSPESGTSAPPCSTETGHYVLSLAALSSIGYVPENLKPVRPTKAMLDCRLSIGDFLISRSNTQELVGLVGIFAEDRDDVSFPDTMMRLPVDTSRVSKRFLEAVLLSRHGRLHMMRSAAGTSSSMKKINRRTLGSCLIPIPPLKEQERLLERFLQLRETERGITDACRASRALKTAILESFFKNHS